MQRQRPPVVEADRDLIPVSSRGLAGLWGGRNSPQRRAAARHNPRKPSNVAESRRPEHRHVFVPGASGGESGVAEEPLLPAPMKGIGVTCSHHGQSVPTAVLPGTARDEIRRSPLFVYASLAAAGFLAWQVPADWTTSCPILISTLQRAADRTRCELPAAATATAATAAAAVTHGWGTSAVGGRAP